MEKYSLVGINGNAFAIMDYVIEAMRECNKTEKEILQYKEEAMSSDYNNLLYVSADMIEELNELITKAERKNFEEKEHNTFENNSNTVLDKISFSADDKKLFIDILSESLNIKGMPDYLGTSLYELLKHFNISRK